MKCSTCGGNVERVPFGGLRHSGIVYGGSLCGGKPITPQDTPAAATPQPR